MPRAPTFNHHRVQIICTRKPLRVCISIYAPNLPTPKHIHTRSLAPSPFLLPQPAEHRLADHHRDFDLRFDLQPIASRTIVLFRPSDDKMLPLTLVAPTPPAPPPRTRPSPISLPLPPRPPRPECPTTGVIIPHPPLLPRAITKPLPLRQKELQQSLRSWLSNQRPRPNGRQSLSPPLCPEELPLVQTRPSLAIAPPSALLPTMPRPSQSSPTRTSPPGPAPARAVSPVPIPRPAPPTQLLRIGIIIIALPWE